MLSTAQADGLVQSGDGSILEEYLDSIMVMPVVFKRLLALLREADERCHKDTDLLTAKQNEYIDKVKETFKNKDEGNWENRQSELALVAPELKSEIEEIRNRLHQMADQKKSIAAQLLVASGDNLRRLEHDHSHFRSILSETGELSLESQLAVGWIVAAFVQSHHPPSWILARVTTYSSLTPGRCVVADADNSQNKYTLRRSKVVVLPPDEDVQGATSRLPAVGKRVMALYPGATIFYKSLLIAAPYIASTLEGENLAGQVVVAVRFLDDADEKGTTPKRIMPSKYVFHTDKSNKATQ